MANLTPRKMTEKPILIIGLGNPILGDDGFGWVFVEKLSNQLSSRIDLEFDFLSLGGLSLMERLEGYQKVIILDAITSRTKEKGYIHFFPLDLLPVRSSGHTISAHDTDLRTALEVGRSMNIDLPDDNNILVIGVETDATYDFKENLSPEIVRAFPGVLDLVLSLI